MNLTLPVPQVVIDWVTEHPFQTVVHIANGVILCTPAAITAPIFSALGFSALGPASGVLTTHLTVPSDLTSSRFSSKRSHELFRLCSGQWCIRYNPERCYGWLWCGYCCWSSAGRGRSVFGCCLGLGMEDGEHDPILRYIMLLTEPSIEDCCLLSIIATLLIAAR
jgi:hypothetical protein